jgi:chloramphenicol 3-O-phosphotransferase
MASGAIPLTAAQVRALNTLVNDQEMTNLIVDEVAVHRLELPDGSDHFAGTLHVRVTVSEPGEDGATHAVESLLGVEGDVVSRSDAR